MRAKVRFTAVSSIMTAFNAMRCSLRMQLCRKQKACRVTADRFALHICPKLNKHMGFAKTAQHGHTFGV